MQQSQQYIWQQQVQQQSKYSTVQYSAVVREAKEVKEAIVSIRTSNEGENELFVTRFHTPNTTHVRTRR